MNYALKTCLWTLILKEVMCQNTQPCDRSTISGGQCDIEKKYGLCCPYVDTVHSPFQARTCCYAEGFDMSTPISAFLINCLGATSGLGHSAVRITFFGTRIFHGTGDKAGSSDNLGIDSLRLADTSSWGLFPIQNVVGYAWPCTMDKCANKSAVDQADDLIAMLKINYPNPTKNFVIYIDIETYNHTWGMAYPDINPYISAEQKRINTQVVKDWFHRLTTFGYTVGFYSRKVHWEPILGSTTYQDIIAGSNVTDIPPLWWVREFIPPQPCEGFQPFGGWTSMVDTIHQYDLDVTRRDCFDVKMDFNAHCH